MMGGELISYLWYWTIHFPRSRPQREPVDLPALCSWVPSPFPFSFYIFLSLSLCLCGQLGRKCFLGGVLGLTWLASGSNVRTSCLTPGFPALSPPQSLKYHFGFYFPTDRGGWRFEDVRRRPRSAFGKVLGLASITGPPCYCDLGALVCKGFPALKP